MYASLKQVRPVSVPLESAACRILGLFDGGVAAGNGADPDGGKIVLPAGSWLVAFSGNISWRFAPSIEVLAVVAGDVRFRGPRCVAVGDRDVRRVKAAVRRVEARVFGNVETEHAVEVLSRQVGTFGVVSLPPGDPGDPVSVEIWASAATGQHDAENVRFDGFEILAVALHGPSTSTSQGVQGE